MTTMTTTSRDLVIKTLNHQPVDRAPRDLWCSPTLEAALADELAEMNVRYPPDIAPPDFKYPPGKRSKGKPHRVGDYTDAWGCTWQLTERGAVEAVKEPPLADAVQMAEYKPPLELLDRSKLARLNRSCATTNRFVLAWTETRPFDRLRFLCGAETACAELRQGTQAVRSLLAALNDFSCQEIEMWAGTEVDGVVLRDDWASPESLLLDLEIWRDLFRPLYREYCKILHARDKFVFFHSQGNITELFGELIRAGIDAVHSQLFLMDLERLAKRYRGRVTFWGEIGPQAVLTQGTVAQVREAVVRVRRALDFGRGSVIAQCEWTPGTPLKNVAALFEQWSLPLPMNA